MKWAVVVTGGAALALLVCALGGAAIGTAISDSETGYNRSWGDYWERLITGSSIRFMAGASVYGLIVAMPAAASAAGEHDVRDFYLYGGYSTRNCDSRRLWTRRGRV